MEYCSIVIELYVAKWFYEFFLICILLFYRYVIVFYIVVDKVYYDVMDVLLKYGVKVGIYFIS